MQQNTGTTPGSSINIQVAAEGFGSYLQNILPSDVAVAAGAFSATMQQIRNITKTNIEQFAQIVPNIETTRGLSQVNGTQVPTDTTLVNQGMPLVALGSGPSGTYTMSDLFGSMSGLPYPWKNIQSNIEALQTSTLSSIYRELFLAVTWERATASVQYTTYVIESPPGTFTTWYRVTGVTLTDAGGGYGRGGAPAPTVTMTGGTCTATIGTNDADAGSNGAGTFGRVTSLNFTSGPDITTVPTISIDYPPGGTSFSNSIVQSYIDQANAEIASIYGTKNPAVTNLNIMWNSSGTQLTVEQRARYTAFPPVPDPKDEFLSQYPASLLGFVDAVPEFAKNTLPHMQAATLEAIANWSTVGGQSLVALMRQERNQDRLEKAGIPLDNNIPDKLNPIAAKVLQANGTSPLANIDTGVPADTVCGPYTIPSLLSVSVDGQVIVPEPSGYYDQSTDDFYTVNQTGDAATVYGNMLTVPNCTDPVVVGQVLPIGVGVPEDTGGPKVPGSLASSDYQNLIPPNLNTSYTGGVLTSSNYKVNEAIDEVIKCNCDCWVA